MQCRRVIPLSLHCQWKPKDDFAPLKLKSWPLNKLCCEMSLTSRKLFSKATLMLVSMLVLFLRRRFRPSKPSPGEPRELGLDRAWSDVWFSAQTARTKAQRDWYKHLWQTAMQTCLRASAVLLSNSIHVKDLLYITNHRRIQKRELRAAVPWEELQNWRGMRQESSYPF